MLVKALILPTQELAGSRLIDSLLHPQLTFPQCLTSLFGELVWKWKGKKEKSFVLKWFAPAIMHWSILEWFHQRSVTWTWNCCSGSFFLAVTMEASLSMNLGRMRCRNQTPPHHCSGFRNQQDISPHLLLVRTCVIQQMSTAPQLSAAPGWLWPCPGWTFLRNRDYEHGLLGRTRKTALMLPCEALMKVWLNFLSYKIAVKMLVKYYRKYALS